MAAAGVPSLATADLATLRAFSAAGLTVALLSHLTFSILVGLLYTVLLPMLPPQLEWLFGGVMTPLIWTALIYPTFNLINPALAARVDWGWFVVCQVSFGLVGGLCGLQVPESGNHAKLAAGSKNGPARHATTRQRRVEALENGQMQPRTLYWISALRRPRIRLRLRPVAG